MFSIYLDDRVLWDPNYKNKQIFDTSVDMIVSKVGSFTFKILPTHELYNSIVKGSSIITIKQRNKTIFKGRVYSDEKDFYKRKKIEVEGLMAYLNDSIVRPYSFSGSVADYFTMLITQHNDQVEPKQRFKVGRVTVTDPNDYIVRSSSVLPKTFKEINDKLIKTLGGYLVIRYESDGNYLDYLSSFTDTSLQEIAYSVNLMDIKSSGTIANLVTRLIPYGAENEETKERVTIESVNDGLDYIQDDQAVASYGVITDVVYYDDVTLPSNLLRKAQIELSTRVLAQGAIKISVLDLARIDGNIDPLEVAQYVKVYSKPHDLDVIVPILQYKFDPLNPENGRVTLEISRASYLEDQLNNAISKDTIINEVNTVVSGSTTTIKNEVLSETTTLINNQGSTIEGNTRELLKNYVSTGTLEEYKESISTTIQETANGIDLSFKTINDRITDENGELKREYQEFLKYIRFTGGNIILGEEGAILTTKIQNGRISFLYNDNLEVAYITDKKLYITEAEIIDKIVLGNFAFIPRKNGNLSFKKIRG